MSTYQNKLYQCLVRPIVSGPIVAVRAQPESGINTRSRFDVSLYSPSRLKAAVLLAVASTILSTSPVMAQDDPADACIEAARLIREDNDLVGALDEARWCVEGLEQLKQQQTLAVLPDEVDGFKGGETSSEKVLGMSMIERKYARDSSVIEVSLTGAGGAGGGLAAIAQMGMKLGAQAGKKLRIQRRTVVDMSEGSNPTFMVQLRSGSVLNISSNNTDYETTLSFIKAFPIADLDDVLKE